MQSRVLIDSIVRQTTVLIAHVATASGLRAPLAHVADRVFADLTAELEAQGVSRKVAADMFGMALRSYVRKARRVAESNDSPGRLLWEAVFEWIGEQELVERDRVFARFCREDDEMLRGILRDLVDSGLLTVLRRGKRVSYQANPPDEYENYEGLDSHVWLLVFRESPIEEAELLRRIAAEDSDIQESLQRLIADKRVTVESTNDSKRYRSEMFGTPGDPEVGFAAAVSDHFQAMTVALCMKLRGDGDNLAPGVPGGGTWTIDVWPGHPCETEALSLFAETRSRAHELVVRAAEFNRENPTPHDARRVTFYAGQMLAEAKEQDDE